MNTAVLLVLWCLLFVFSWPLALLALLLLPVVWLLSLPLRLLGLVVGSVFDILRAVLGVPARLLGYRKQGPALPNPAPALVPAVQRWRRCSQRPKNALRSSSAGWLETPIGSSLPSLALPSPARRSKNSTITRGLIPAARRSSRA